MRIMTLKEARKRSHKLSSDATKLSIDFSDNEQNGHLPHLCPESVS